MICLFSLVFDFAIITILLLQKAVRGRKNHNQVDENRNYGSASANEVSKSKYDLSLEEFLNHPGKPNMRSNTEWTLLGEKHSEKFWSAQWDLSHEECYSGP